MRYRQVGVITPDMEGKHVKCRIDGASVDDGLLIFDTYNGSGHWFICQNVRQGSEPENMMKKKGYKYSWVLTNGVLPSAGVDLLMVEDENYVEYDTF